MSAFPSVIELTALDGSDGFQINGEAAYDKSGMAVSSAGDINGDGFADLVIGAPGTNAHGNETGTSYVIYGTASGFGSMLELSDLDGSNGFAINGQVAGELAGRSVTSSGDFNGDGITDLLIGGPGASPTNTNAGATYVLYGTTSGFASPLELAGIDGTNGFRIDGEKQHDGSGWSVDSAGDFNGDGLSDVVIGAYGADPNGAKSGSTYVVFGSTSTFSNDLLLKDLDGTNGFRINGEAAGDFSGRAVSGAGDVNGDGFADVVIGAQYATANGVKSGAAYVVFGAASVSSSSMDLSALDGTNGFKINGVSAGNETGFSVASAGDVNGDGVGDLVIGAPGADPHGNGSGAAYVVFGQSSGFSSSLDLSALDGTNGFRISGEAAHDGSGFSVASAGDFNGDGFSDLIIGAPYATANGHSYGGAAYVVFGSASGYSSNLNLADLDGSNGFKIDGGAAHDFSGFSVHSAGDLNGDGLTDLVVGAYGADPNGNQSGSSYVIYGAMSGSAVTRVGTAADDKIVGGGGADKLVGLGGFDTLIGGGGNDTLYGGAQGDHLFGNDGADVLVGGNGNDTILGNAGGDSLYGGGGADRLFGGVGADQLQGGVGKDLLFGGSGNDTLSGGGWNDTLYGGAQSDHLYGNDGADKLYGGTGDDTLVGGTGDDTLVGGAQGDHLYGSGGADKLYGGNGYDLLQGGTGDDTLIGGNGEDTLTGGGGNDTFVFKSAAQTPPGPHHDHITDFTPDHHDVIDLSQIDAAAGVTGAFIGTSAFSHTAGEVHYYYYGGHTIVAGDISGNGTADFRIELDTAHLTLSGGDFLL